MAPVSTTTTTTTTTKEPVIVDASSTSAESTVMLDEDVLKLRPLGAGQEVGRSCIYMEFKGKKILMDMGIHPGLNGMESLPFVDLIDPEEIDLLLISHFHLDHCGALPWFLTKTNFRGRCFMTHATKAIYRWLLADCIKVSNISTEMMLYTEADLERSMEKIEVINFHEEKEVAGVRFWCYNAGHVLGAAMFMLEIAGVKILYTGDFSRQEDRHLMSAEIPAILPDVLIIESTYGTHIHEPREDREARFTGIVYDTVTRGGRCLIPVFALGRAQELLLILDEYWSQHPELHDIPIYYASSLAKKCMSVYQTYISAMNSRIKRQIAINNPFVFKHISNLKSIDHFEDVGPCVVMATPGMMQSGLSRELFEAWCGHRANCCIIAGYCVEGTLAKQILSEPEEIVAQSGQKLPRRCQIEYISFSAHTDYRQTSEFVRALRPPHIVMVHGEANEMGRLKSALMREYEDTEAPPAFHNPKNTVAVELHFRGEKIAKVMGCLAMRGPSEGLRLSGVLVKRNFAYHLLAPADLHKYTDMVVSTVDQRLTVPLGAGTAVGESFEALVAALDGLAVAVLEEGLSLVVMGMIKVSYNPKPKASLPALPAPPPTSSSTTTTTTTSSSPPPPSSPVAVLEWTSSPAADLVADSIVALLMKGTLSEKEVAALTTAPNQAAASKDSTDQLAMLPPTKPKAKSGKAVSAAGRELLFTNFLIDSLREMFNLEKEDFSVGTREVEVTVTEEVPEEEEGAEGDGAEEGGGKNKEKDTAAEMPPKMKEEPMDEDVETEMEMDEAVAGMSQQPKRAKKTRETLRRETHKILAEHSLTILGGGSTADLQAYLFRINSLSIASKPSIRMLTYHNGGGEGDGEGETSKPLFPVTRFTDWNSLLFGAVEGPYKAELNSATVETIVSVFPHITELTFAVYRNANYEHLIDMLTHRRWNQQLARLTLVDHHQCRISAAMNRILFATLNTLASLKVLAFSLFPQCQLYDLPLLAQLDEVAVCVDDAVLPTFLQSLERHADANLALQVAIRSDATEHLFTLSGHLRNRLVRFCNTKLGYSSNSVPLLCANFRQLTTLSIYSHTSRILKSLFADLTQLPYLFHLDISIDFRYECDAVHHLAVLPSVRALDLQLFITSHQQVRDLNLRSALPNLAALHLHYFWCIECDRPSYLCTDDLKEEEEEGKMELTLKCLFLTLSDLHSGVPPECISIEEFPGTAAQMFAQKSCI